MKALAIDTSTETLSVAVCVGAGNVLAHSGPGAAQASSTLIPSILALLGQAGLAVQDLDAIAFGQGPGSFTGLRTACAVAQGLGFGAGVPLVPVPTLMAVAEEARQRLGPQPPGAPFTVLALLDARMDEIYVSRWSWSSGRWHASEGVGLTTLRGLADQDQQNGLAGVDVMAGNIFDLPGAGFLKDRQPVVPCGPTATAMLRLLPQLLAEKRQVDAEEALPLYVRDRVAKTTAEREQERGR